MIIFSGKNDQRLIDYCISFFSILGYFSLEPKEIIDISKVLYNLFKKHFTLYIGFPYCTNFLHLKAVTT